MMKKIIILAATMAVITTNLSADNTDTAKINISGNVIANLTVSTTAEMVLPDLVAPEAISQSNAQASTSVLLECDASGHKKTTYSNKGKPVSMGETNGVCAQAIVTGQANYSFAIETTDPMTTSANISISDLTCKGATALNGDGKAGLYCGALVMASTNESIGSYSAQGTITITYD